MPRKTKPTKLQLAVELYKKHHPKVVEFYQALDLPPSAIDALIELRVHNIVDGVNRNLYRAGVVESQSILKAVQVNLYEEHYAKEI